jgi:hypothetical protein
MDEAGQCNIATSLIPITRSRDSVINIKNFASVFDNPARAAQ